MHRRCENEIGHGHSNRDQTDKNMEKQINQYCYQGMSDKSSHMAYCNLRLKSLDHKERRETSKDLKISDSGNFFEFHSTD